MVFRIKIDYEPSLTVFQDENFAYWRLKQLPDMDNKFFVETSEGIKGFIHCIRQLKDDLKGMVETWFIEIPQRDDIRHYCEIFLPEKG